MQPQLYSRVYQACTRYTRAQHHLPSCSCRTPCKFQGHAGWLQHIVTVTPITQRKRVTPGDGRLQAACQALSPASKFECHDMCCSIESTEPQVLDEQAGILTHADLATQCSAWYPAFRQHALRSQIVPLPTAFVDYLLSDGVYLGDGSKALFKAAEDEDEHTPQAAPQQHDPPSDSDDEDDGSSAATQQDWTELFPELHGQIQAYIEELGGKVVPKLNWSCPSDAVWVNPGSSLACDNADQVVLMLKSSDRVAHDLDRLTNTSSPAAPHPPQPTLVLRKWHDLRPEREWRCFVRSGQLVAISQRDPTQHFPQLCTSASIWEEPAQGSPEEAASGGASTHSAAADPQPHPAEVVAGPVAREARSLLEVFHRQHVRHKFPLAHYTYDAYVATNNVIKILDFNPVGSTTSPLLFTWEELGLHEVDSNHPNHFNHQQSAASQTEQPTATTAPATQDTQTSAAAPEEEQAGPVLLRVVPAASFVHPGQRMVCGMPYDMLGLQDSGTVEGMIQRMQML